jgi:hypothetical protein
MSFPKKRLRRQAEDRAYEKAAGVKHRDPEAERYAGGNVYSSADLEELERGFTRYWRRRKRR